MVFNPGALLDDSDARHVRSYAGPVPCSVQEPEIVTPPKGALIVLFEGPWILTERNGSLVAAAAKTAYHSYPWGVWDPHSGLTDRLSAGTYPATFDPPRSNPTRSFTGLFDSEFAQTPFTYLNSPSTRSGETRVELDTRRAHICIQLAMPDDLYVAVTACSNGTLNRDPEFDHHPTEKGRDPLTFVLTYHNTRSLTLGGKTIVKPVLYFTINVNHRACMGDKMCMDLHQRIAFDDLRRLAVKTGGTAIQMCSEPTDDYDIVRQPPGLSKRQLGVDDYSLLNKTLAACAHGGFVLGPRV